MVVQLIVQDAPFPVISKKGLHAVQLVVFEHEAQLLIELEHVAPQVLGVVPTK